MTDEVLLFDPAESDGGIVVILLAAVIYPGSIRKRERFIEAAFAYGVRVCRHHGMPTPAWASAAMGRVTARNQRTQLQAAERILRRRLQAGRALQIVILSRGARSLTSVAKRSGGNRSHFMHATWAQSLPVLHLSWSVLTASSRRHPADRRPLLLSLLARASWAREAAQQSESKLALLSRLAELPQFAETLRGFAATTKVRVIAHCADSPTG